MLIVMRLIKVIAVHVTITYCWTGLLEYQHKYEASGHGNNLTSVSQGLKQNGYTNGSAEAQQYLALPLINRVDHYAIQLAIGEPSQLVEFALDTGSSDFYILDNSTCLNSSTNFLTNVLVFDSSKSETLAKNGTSFSFQYAQDWSIYGEWVRDSIHFGNVSIKNFNFILAQSASRVSAFGGIGFATNELSDHQYPNLPMVLKENGQILYLAYSVWINSQSEAQGSIVFGGIDTNKMDSDMYVFPMLPWLSEKIDTFAIKLDGIALEYPHGSIKQRVYSSIPIVLDVGVTLSRLPHEILEPFYRSLGIDINTKTFVLPCQKLMRGGGFSLHFSGVEYFFSFHDISVKIDSEGDMCVPGFFPSNIPVLGTNFMSSLYVVFDLQKKEIGMALGSLGPLHSTKDLHYSIISTGIPGKRAPYYSLSHLDSVFDQTLGKFLVNPSKPSPTFVSAPQVIMGKSGKTGLAIPLAPFDLVSMPKPP